MFQVEQLTIVRTGQPSARNARIGRVWRKIGPLVKRHTVAEAIQKRCMIDDPSITRIKHIAR